MSEEIEVLKIVTERLERAEIGYMVTGSMALNYYALPRMTRDIDLVVELSTPDAQRIVDLFREGFILTSVRDLDRAYLAEWIAHPRPRCVVPRGEPMKDTSPEIERRYRAMLLQRSAEDRFLMGDSMYATARALVRASILAAIPDASPAQMRQQIFLRFYGHEFDPPILDKILASLGGGSRAQQNAAAR